MKNKVLFVILIVLAALLTIGGGTVLTLAILNPDPLILNNMTIVMPAESTQIEKTAVAELNTYFEKATGGRLPVVTETDAAVDGGIYIGNTNYAKNNQVTYPEAPFQEGWAIKAVGDDLVLCGGEGRGVLYAVYHLLEDRLNVRWWTYWETDTPKMDVVEVPGNYNDSGKPSFAWRDIHGGKTSIQETNTFCVHNRLNGDTSNAPMAYGGEEAFGKPAHVHTIAHYFNEKDFNAHPEWFAYGAGWDPYIQVCLTNEDLMKETATRVLANIEKSFAEADAAGINRPRYFDLSPNDTEAHCSCTNCFMMRKEKGHSGVLLNFVNTVAAEVQKKYPEVFMETLAYMSYIDAPVDDTKPADNVVIRLCLSSRDCLHGLSHANNASTLKQIKDWVAITKDGQLYVWDYSVFYMNPGVSPMVMDYAEDLRILHELGVDGYFSEMENPIMSDFWDMKFWMHAKLAEDPYQDEDKLIDDFLNGYYGAAGPYLRQYLELVHEKAEAYTGYWTYGSETMSPKWITIETMVEAQKLMDQAMDAVKDDYVLARRVRQCRNALDRVFVERHEYYANEAKAKGITLTFTAKEVCQRIVDVFEEQIDWRGDYDYDALMELDNYKRKLKMLS